MTSAALASSPPPKRSMQNDDAYIADMMNAARDALAALEGVTREQFARDRTRQLAVRLAQQIIGEAARHISEKRRQLYPGLAWRDMIGLWLYQAGLLTRSILVWWEPRLH